MDTLLVKPENSLLLQSRFARQNYVTGLPNFPDGAFPTNGDGFGFGWYGERSQPGIYREFRPAWSDQNFTNLARQLKSGLFMAHLRAAYDGVVQRTNSHPFSYKNFMLQHNGEVVGFKKMRREIMLELRPEYFDCVTGTTDTEVLFYLALELGMDEDVKAGLERMTGRIEKARQAHSITDPCRLTLVVSDGEALYGLRYSSDQDSKTMYINKGSDALRQIEGDVNDIPDKGIVLLSEPLDDCSENWELLGESSFVEVRDGNVEISRFSPRD